jgi:ABC-2 type transport system permease protein
MSFIDLLRAEYHLVYGEVFRRKQALLAVIIYPYLFTAFMLFLGYAGGSPRAFVERVGVEPAVYLVTANYMLVSILASVDDLLWRPLMDSRLGTFAYIMVSPVNRLKLFFAVPIPRLTLVIITGSTSVFPVYFYYYGFKGLELGSIVMLLVIVGCFVMIPFATVVASLVHTLGESWRVLNIVRPLIMILLGIYYPRVYMPIASYVLSSLIPSSHIVEVVQRILMGIHGDYIVLLFILAFTVAFLYTPTARLTVKAWEQKKVSEGVKV